MNCNKSPGGGDTQGELFQSLIGILVNCNRATQKFVVKSSSVSIPNRDFGELQLITHPRIAVRAWFQSLIGILVNCN